MEEKGKVFKSFDEWKAVLSTYQNEKKVRFRVRSSTSVESYNKELKKKKKKIDGSVSEEIKFRQVDYECIHYGNRRYKQAAKTGPHEPESYKGQGCKSKFTVIYSHDQKGLVVKESTACFSHNNHPALKVKPSERRAVKERNHIPNSEEDIIIETNCGPLETEVKPSPVRKRKRKPEGGQEAIIESATLWELLLMKLEQSHGRPARADQIYLQFLDLLHCVRQACSQGLCASIEEEKAAHSTTEPDKDYFKIEDEVIAHCLGMTAGTYFVQELPFDEFTSSSFKSKSQQLYSKKKQKHFPSPNKKASQGYNKVKAEPNVIEQPNSFTHNGQSEGDISTSCVDHFPTLSYPPTSSDIAIASVLNSLKQDPEQIPVASWKKRSDGNSDPKVELSYKRQDSFDSDEGGIDCNEDFAEESNTGEELLSAIPKLEGEPVTDGVKLQRCNVTCNDCGKIFSSAENLKKHNTRFHGNRGSLCSICRKYFSNSYLYSKHMNMKHGKCIGKARVACNLCKRTFSSQLRLRKHKQIHEKLAAFENCKVVFAEDCQPLENENVGNNPDQEIISHPKQRPMDLEENIEERSNSIKSYSCDLCSFQGSSSSHLLLHAKSQHSDQGSFMCGHCRKVFPAEFLLQRHMRTAHSKKKTHECPICKITFSSSHTLENHVALHSGEKTFSCPLCSNTFTVESYMKRHIKIKHPNYHAQNIKPASKKYEKYLKIGSDGKKAYFCDVCNKSFQSGSHLTTHMMIHSNEKPFLCHFCDRRFNDISNLNKHLREVHAKDKLFECEQCHKTFSCARLLKSHQITHLAHKRYTCEVCGKPFNYKSNLLNHFRMHHTLERPYKCTSCEKSFVCMGNLRKHLATHTGLKPFQCDMCSKSFTRSASLKRHKQTSQQCRTTSRDHVMIIQVSHERVIEEALANIE